MHSNRKIIEIDYSIPSWNELGSAFFLGGLAGALLSIAVCAMAVVL